MSRNKPGTVSGAEGATLGALIESSNPGLGISVTHLRE